MIRQLQEAFPFDGVGVPGKGGKTPLGDGKLFELVNTPEKIANYLDRDDSGIWWHEKEKYLCIETFEL